MSVNRNKADTAAAVSMAIANSAAKMVIRIIVGSLKSHPRKFPRITICY